MQQIRRSARIGFTAFILTTLAACSEDPTCAVTGTLGGDVTGEFAWAGVGIDACAVAGDVVDFYEGGDHLYFFPGSGSDFEWKVGTYDDMTVGFTTSSSSWLSDGCGVAIDTLEREDWTKYDYLSVTGRIVCPPLTNGLGSIELQSVTFASYFMEVP